MRDTSAYRQKLEGRLKELTTRLQRIEDDLDDPMQKDLEDQAVELEDDEVLERLGAAGQQEMRQISDALQRIEDGSYGICMRCGDEISHARLDAVPYTLLCRDCAQGVEAG